MRVIAASGQTTCRYGQEVCEFALSRKAQHIEAQQDIQVAPLHRQLCNTEENTGGTKIGSLSARVRIEL